MACNRHATTHLETAVHTCHLAAAARHDEVNDNAPFEYTSDNWWLAVVGICMLIGGIGAGKCIAAGVASHFR